MASDQSDSQSVGTLKRACIFRSNRPRFKYWVHPILLLNTTGIEVENIAEWLKKQGLEQRIYGGMFAESIYALKAYMLSICFSLVEYLLLSIAVSIQNYENFNSELKEPLYTVRVHACACVCMRVYHVWENVLGRVHLQQFNCFFN